MARPRGQYVLAALLAGLLLVDAALGQTFTYSRGWKPGGKRSRGPPSRSAVRQQARVQPRVQPRGGALPRTPLTTLEPLERASAADSPRYLDDEQPIRYFVETPGDHWATQTADDTSVLWRAPDEVDGDYHERRAEQTTIREEHDDH